MRMIQKERKERKDGERKKKRWRAIARKKKMMTEKRRGKGNITWVLLSDLEALL